MSRYTGSNDEHHQLFLNNKKCNPKKNNIDVYKTDSQLKKCIVSQQISVITHRKTLYIKQQINRSSNLRAITENLVHT